MNQNRSGTTFVAQYRKVESELRKQVRSGRWNAGVMLPSHRDLAREYQVSSGTIRRAVDALITEGLLRADSRRGTFALQTGFSRETTAHDGRPSGGAFAEGDAPDSPHETSTRPLVVGIVAALDDEQNGQSAAILHALERALSEGGHVTSVCNRTQTGEEALLPLDAAIQASLRDGVEALAVICLELDRVRVEEALGRVDLHGIPVVCILAGELHLPIPHVFYDNRIGGYQAARHLLDKGHRQITVFAPFSASWVSERIAGIRHALTHTRDAAPDLQIRATEGRTWDYLCDPTALGTQAARDAFEAGWTAQGGVICISDQVAHGVCHVASQYGYKVGRDFAVVGFDDEKCARSGGLTTLRPPLEAMGREAARLLMDEARGSHVSLQLRLRAHLITRASTNLVPPVSL